MEECLNFNNLECGNASEETKTEINVDFNEYKYIYSCRYRLFSKSKVLETTLTYLHAETGWKRERNKKKNTKNHPTRYTRHTIPCTL